MKETEVGSEKVKKICEVLRKETLEPAKRQAEEIVLEAEKRAEALLEEAKKNIERMHIEAREEIDRRKNIFQSSLHQACKQTLDTLKQSIEEKLLNQQLAKIITQNTVSTEVITQLISSVIKAIEKEGIDAQVSAYIPAAVSVSAVNGLLGKTFLDRLKEKSVLIGPMSGGIEIKLHDNAISIDISDVVLKELVASYIRKDFRDMFFANAELT